MSQTSNILSSYSNSRYYITIKFKTSIKVTSLSSDKFTFQTIEATPTVFPFKSIVLSDDYNSIGRTLTLYFEDVLPPETGDYHLVLDGLIDASGQGLQLEALKVPYNYDNEPIEEPVHTPPPISIEDKSIKADAFAIEETLFGTSTEFYVVETDPPNGEIFVDKTYNNGRIAVIFNTRPSLTYINSQYIKVQRKKISTSFNRWENLEVELSLDSYSPTVYIDMPSIDATPVYYTNGHDYLEDGYKYRIRLSGSIAPQE